MSSTGCEKRIENIVTSAAESSGLFYTIRQEPMPTKTCFDATLTTYGTPSTEHIVTVTIPKTFPYTPPQITSKTDKKLKFQFLNKAQWKPSMGIGEVLIEACHQLSRTELDPRRPTIATLRPPSRTTSTGLGATHAPSSKSFKSAGSRSPPKG